jgi:hypothetical protein
MLFMGRQGNVRGFGGRIGLPAHVLVLALLGLGSLPACVVDSSGLARPSRQDSGWDADADADADRDADADHDADIAPDADADPGRDSDVAPDSDEDRREDGDVAPDSDQERADADPDPDPSCLASDERCVGNSRWYCDDDELRHQDCGSSHHCEVSSASPECVDNICDPDSTRCSADDTTILTCDARGASESSEPCPRGCHDDECRAQTPCDAAVFATTSGGTFRVNLCDAGSDQDHTSECGWPEQSVPGEDVLIRIEVDRTRTIRFQASQVSEGETIDPTLYLRSDCDDESSEIWCHEDTNDQDEDFVEELDPGDYFLVVDRHERATTSCGELEVRITPE